MISYSATFQMKVTLRRLRLVTVTNLPSQVLKQCTYTVTIWILAKLRYHSSELWYPYILMSHPILDLIFWCCDIGLELLWYWSIPDIRYYDIGYYDIGVSLISEVLWYRSFPDITVPLPVTRISEFASCDIRIYGYHSQLWYRSYSDFWVPDIKPDIPVSELWYRDIYWCHSSWYRSFSDIRIPDIILDVSLPLPFQGLAFQLIQLVQYQ
jgi:hypothetical protein